MGFGFMSGIPTQLTAAMSLQKALYGQENQDINKGVSSSDGTQSAMPSQQLRRLHSTNWRNDGDDGDDYDD